MLGNYLFSIIMIPLGTIYLVFSRKIVIWYSKNYRNLSLPSMELSIVIIRIIASILIIVGIVTGILTWIS